MKMELKFTVNGEERELYIDPKMLLVEVLREELGLTGTHWSCDTGACCCCTVNVDGMAVKSCSMLAMQAYGREVTTIEGLARGPKYTQFSRLLLIIGLFNADFVPPGKLWQLMRCCKRIPARPGNRYSYSWMAISAVVPVTI
jgi:aerobic-type carbon monoxide dehydrogenase small subunit (CoxS/CutS family)